MKFKSAAIVSSIILANIAWSSTAHSASINISLKANRTSGLYTYIQYDPNTCGAMMMPKFKVKYVKNGKITGSKGSFKLTKGICKGRSMKGVAFRYTPNRGFRGTDKASIQLNMPAYTDGSGNASRSLDFIIQVK
jgi:hypothetical protein